MTDFLLVIDRGATTTVLTLRDASGRIIYEGISTGSNYHVIGTNAFRKVILILIYPHPTKFRVSHSVGCLEGPNHPGVQKVI